MPIKWHNLRHRYVCYPSALLRFVLLSRRSLRCFFTDVPFWTECVLAFIWDIMEKYTYKFPRANQRKSKFDHSRSNIQNYIQISDQIISSIALCLTPVHYIIKMIIKTSVQTTVQLIISLNSKKVLIIMITNNTSESINKCLKLVSGSGEIIQIVFRSLYNYEMNQILRTNPG